MIRRRDGMKCRICGSKENPTVAHIIAIRFDRKLKHDPNNAVLLCRSCEDAYGDRFVYRIKGEKVPMIAYLLNLPVTPL